MDYGRFLMIDKEYNNSIINSEMMIGSGDIINKSCEDM